MAPITSQIVDGIFKAGSISGLLALLFNIREQLRKRSRFKFDFQGTNGRNYVQHGHLYLELNFDGFVKNQGNEVNSITQVSTIIWKNKSRTQTLSQNTACRIFRVDNGEELFLPILFQPREGHRLRIQFDLCLTGTQLVELVQARVERPAGSGFHLPRHEFKLAFKDVNETLFDDTGRIRSQKLINLWWTLPNAIDDWKRGKRLPILMHTTAIFVAYVGWRLKLIASAIGL